MLPNHLSIRFLDKQLFGGKLHLPKRNCALTAFCVDQPDPVCRRRPIQGGVGVSSARRS